MAHNKYLHLIPWHLLKEYLNAEKEKWTLLAIGGTGEERDKACGRVLQIVDLLNLPDVLDMLYKEEEEEENDGRSHPQR